MAFKLDGKPLAVDVAFSHNDINYPANWLRLSSAQEKKDLGITEVADAPTYDSRFYWGDRNDDPEHRCQNGIDQPKRTGDRVKAKQKQQQAKTINACHRSCDGKSRQIAQHNHHHSPTGRNDNNHLNRKLTNAHTAFAINLDHVRKFRG